MATASQFGLFENRPPETDVDVCARKSRGNPNSAAAFERVKPYRVTLWERIWTQINTQGHKGLTINDLRIWDAREHKQRFRPANELSPRLTEMSDQTHRAFKKWPLWESGRKDKGCEIYVTKEIWKSGSAERSEP